MYATKRQSRLAEMSDPRLHWAYGLAASVEPVPGSELPSSWPGSMPRNSATISTTSPAPPPIAILPPFPRPPPPPICDGSRLAPSLYFTSASAPRVAIGRADAGALVGA